MIEAEAQRQAATIEASELSNEERQKEIDKINEWKEAAIGAVNDFHEELKDVTAFNDFVDNLNDFKDKVSMILGGVSELFGALSDLYSASIDSQLEDLDRWYNSEMATLDAWLQAKLEAAGLAEETTLERLQRELEEAMKRAAEGKFEGRSADALPPYVDEVERLLEGELSRIRKAKEFAQKMQNAKARESQPRKSKTKRFKPVK